LRAANTGGMCVESGWGDSRGRRCGMQGVKAASLGRVGGAPVLVLGRHRRGRLGQLVGHVLHELDAYEILIDKMLVYPAARMPRSWKRVCMSMRIFS
jgi:hypothetical protein